MPKKSFAFASVAVAVMCGIFFYPPPAKRAAAAALAADAADGPTRTALYKAVVKH